MKKLLIGILIGMALQAGVVFAFHTLDHTLEIGEENRRERNREFNEQMRHDETIREMKKQRDC